MEAFVVLIFCVICSTRGFSEASIMTPISPVDDEFHDMIVRGESKEILRIVPSVITNFTTTDIQSSSNGSSISFAKSDANVATETSTMTSMNSDHVYGSVTQPTIVPIINEPVGDDEITTMSNISAEIIGSTDDVQGSSHVSLITSSRNDEDVTPDGMPVTLMNSNNTSEIYTPLPTILAKSDPVDNDMIIATTNIPTTFTTTTDNVQPSLPIAPMTTAINIHSGDYIDTDPAINEIEANPADAMGPLARLLINSKKKFAAQGRMDSTLLNGAPGMSGIHSTRAPKMNSNVHQPTPKPKISPAVQAIQTWFREVGHFFNRMVNRVRNFFHRW